MTCLIKCSKGQYCCLAGSDGFLRGFTVNNDPLIIRAANLPPTPLLVQVNKEYIETGDVIGGDVTCVVIRKPGCYKLAIPCADYAGECPDEGCTELCYECDPAYDTLAALADAVAAGAGGDAVVNVTVEPEITVVADVSAITDKLCEIFGVPEEDGPTILDKLCDIALLLGADSVLCSKLTDILNALTNEDGDTLFEKMCELIATFTETGEGSLCSKLDAIINNTAAITGIETSLGQVGCVTDDEGNIIGSVLVCKVSDTTTSPPTDTIKVWLFNTDGSVVENYDGPYEACTNLSALKTCLDNLIKIISSVNQGILDKLCEMFAKQCETLVDCEICSSVTLPSGAAVASFDASGLEEVIDPPATTVAELAQALSNQGYVISNVVSNTITVCGAKLLSAIKLDDGTIVPAVPADAKKGLLVCDPNVRALLAVNQNIEALLQTNNSLLADLVGCLCGPKDEDQCDVDFEVLDGAGEGAYVPFGDAGPNQEWPAPTPNDSGIYSGVGFQLKAPYPECAKGTLRIKLALDHETSGGLYNNGTGGHNGFYLTPSAGSFVTGSGTNGAQVNSATSALIKQNGTSPFGTDRSIRCVEMDVTPAELAAGISFTFGAFGSVGVGGEFLHGIKPTIVNQAELDCSACTAEERSGVKV